MWRKECGRGEACTLCGGWVVWKVGCRVKGVDRCTWVGEKTDFLGVLGRNTWRKNALNRSNPKGGRPKPVGRRRVFPVLVIMEVVVWKEGSRVKGHGKGNSKLPWRKAGPPNHFDGNVDSDQ